MRAIRRDLVRTYCSWWAGAAHGRASGAMTGTGGLGDSAFQWAEYQTDGIPGQRWRGRKMYTSVCPFGELIREREVISSDKRMGGDKGMCGDKGMEW